ncbi:hypothetical protein QN326_07370 [Candidatus Phytoplasma asteris]|uniref:Uncharacterized protein n=1 Tax=Candidatus Phytoplasma asteris TaxID=85620 RepID=A0ABZ3CFH9_9MOLU
MAQCWYNNYWLKLKKLLNNLFYFDATLRDYFYLCFMIYSKV